MKKKIFIFISALFIICLGTGITDYIRVHGFESPWFCILTDGYDDGGSGRYIGLGYSYDIKGNFMPEDELPGVTEYVMKIFGVTVTKGVRD